MTALEASKGSAQSLRSAGQEEVLGLGGIILHLFLHVVLAPKGRGGLRPAEGSCIT